MFDPPMQALETFFFRKRTIFFILIFVCILFSISCGKKREMLIFEKVGERVDDFRKERLLSCRTALLSDAEKIVDSLLLTEAARQLLDSLNRTKPGRPVQPPDVPAIDSSPVRPIFTYPKAASKTN
jgi:hypothetical protein